MLVAVAKTQGTPTYQRYPYWLPAYALLRDLTYRHASDNPGKMSYNYRTHAFLSNDSNFNDIRRLREFPRLVSVDFYGAPQPPTQPFYLFITSGKGWEIWKLKPEAFSLFEDSNYHLCVLLARSANDSEIYLPSNVVFTDAFYRKSGRVSFYFNVPGGTALVFYPLEGLDGTQGYGLVAGRYVSRDYTTSTTSTIYYITYPTTDGDTFLILPKFSMVATQPSPNPPIPDGGIYATSKNAILAHYEGIPMNGKVVAPLNVACGQVTVPKKQLKITVYSGFRFDIEESDAGVIEAPKLSGGIWTLPSDDPNAKLDGYNYYSLNDIDAELVEQYTFDFFEPQLTFKVSSHDDKFIYVGLDYLTGDYSTIGGYPLLERPTYLSKTTSAEVISVPATYFHLSNIEGYPTILVGTTAYSTNYVLYGRTALLFSKVQVTSIIEGEPIPEQKNKDTRFNVAIWDGIPKETELKVMTSYFNPSFTAMPSFFASIYYAPLPLRPAVRVSRDFATFNMNELLTTAPTKMTVGGVVWVDFPSVFFPQNQYAVDMPFGAYELVERSDLTSTDAGRGKETVKVLVWQPMWFSHSFTADPNYGDILATFGFKVITIASPPKVEYIVSGFQVCSAWFQNLLKRLRGTELKDAEKVLLRDCVASLDGFFGAIRVTFHYDKQTGLIYMREWRLGVPFGDPVPLTTFNLQPYHEIRALKDFWSWSLYLDIIDTRTQTIVKRIRIVPTIRSWIVGEVNPNQPIAFTQRKSFANPLVGVNPSSPYTVDRNLNFTQVVGRNPHALISSTLTNINPSVYRQGNYPTRFYPLQAPVTSLRGIPTEYQTAAQKFYGSQVSVVPIQFGNLNAQPIYVVTIPITKEIRAKRDVPYDVIAKWGVGVAIYAAGTQWATLLPYGLADLGNLLHWTVVEFWEDQP